MVIAISILATGYAAEPPKQADRFVSFPVYADPTGARKPNFFPSGYMGDSDLTMSGAYVPSPRGTGPCLRVTYKASGVKGWSGLYWQNPANNWGDLPGQAGYDLRGASRLTFWARGENGGERIHEFRVGGIVGPYPDSDVANLRNVRLTKEWKQYTIDLAGKDLRHVIGGFGLFVNKAECTGGCIVYLDDIVYEGANIPGAMPVQLSTATVVPVISSAPAVSSAPVMSSATVADKELDIKEVDKGLKVSFSSRLMFASGESVLDPASNQILDHLVSLLNAYPSNNVLIEGHTDNEGDKNFNLHLSELRAKSVRDYLLKHGGFAQSRFQIAGFGDTKPIADNTTKPGRLLNRRVEVTILKEAAK